MYIAAGRKYGGLAKDSQEDLHFSSLLNQFRCQIMRMTDVKLNLPLLKENFKEMFINSGETGRFEKEIFLKRHWIEIIKEKHLNIEARFQNNGRLSACILQANIEY